MGLDSEIFGFIFKSAKKAPERNKTGKKFRQKIRGMSSSFEDAVSDMITDLVLDNIDYLLRIIIENKPHELAEKKIDLLKALLSNSKTKAVLEGAKKQRRFIRWDTMKVLEAVMMLLVDNGITFNKEEIRWLAVNIHRIGGYLYT